MPTVSVIVPVFNPGPHIDDLLRTVLEQSLPRDQYEVIFVDDGSTDDTPRRLDALAAEHEGVHVVHIPNSGWPGLPRNTGLDIAQGEYVLFIDNDDYIGPEALERLLARARADDADIVIGKVVGHGKFVPRPLFRRNRSNVTLDWPPLITLLSPHKLFRRAFLVEHGIRFPEGRRRLEDHLFVMHAFFHADSISVLADYPVYHWMLRDASASFSPFEPVGYFANLREVLDLIDEHTEPGAFRDRLYTHWYRGKLLKRVGGRAFVRREEENPEYNRALLHEISRLAHERFGAQHEALIPFHLRIRSRLLRAGDFEGLHALAAFEAQLRAQADTYLRETDGAMQTRVDVRLEGERDPLVFRRVAQDGADAPSRVVWVPPPSLRDRLDEEALEATADLAEAKVQLLVRSVADPTEFVLVSKTEVRLAQEGVPVLIADATVDPATAAAGGPLAAGDYSLEVNPIVAGFTRTVTARRRAGRRAVKLVVDGKARISEATDVVGPSAVAAPAPTSLKLKRRVKRLLGR
ncbi:MAG: epsH 2 [Solirubrobacterales bacterium]|nr:epsH 2 [Solirubrobacterales bacterium]